MSFDGLMRHQVQILRAEMGELDPEGEDYGHPDREPEVIVTVPCRIEPKMTLLGRAGGVEEPSVLGTGAQTNDYVVFMRPTDVTPADEMLVLSPYPLGFDEVSNRMEVIQVRDAGAQGHHLEIDVRRTVPHRDDEIPEPEEVS